MTFWGWCFRGCSWGICWCWGLFCSDRKHNNNQFLSLSTIILVSTNEKERTRLIKLKHRGTRIHSLERLLCVAAVVIIFCHPQHRVRPFIVLEDYATNPETNAQEIKKQTESCQLKTVRQLPKQEDLPRESLTWNRFLSAQ